MTILPYLSPLSMVLSANDGLILRGSLDYPSTNVGSRYPLAVLAHQYPSTRDSFAPLVADLLSMGVATLTFDERGHGRSTRSRDGMLVIDAPLGLTAADFGTAFVSSISKVGFHHIEDDVVRVVSWGVSQNYIDASKIILVGGSVGGSGVLLAAPRLGAALRGTVTVGAAGALAFGADAPARIRSSCENVKAPFFLSSSEGDPFDGAKSVRDWSARLAHVETKIVPGDGHAMAIYYDVRDDLLDFVAHALA